MNNEETKKGMYGDFGGAFLDTKFVPYLNEVEAAFEHLKNDAAFVKELARYHREYIGRETPLYFAERLSQAIGGAKIYLKREDMCHTGAHKLNNALGQILLAKHMGKKRIVAETGAGQHGVATATVCALFGLPCTIYMGAEDITRQEMNVFRMKLLGAEVVSVEKGSKTLSDAVDAAFDDLTNNISDTFYLLGSAVGPHPYPEIVKYFQSVIGAEAKQQFIKKEGKLPNYVVACVGGGSNAIGMFSAFVGDEVNLVAAEAGGKGLTTKEHCATLELGTLGTIHGFKCLLLKDDNGEVAATHSISAGLDYPGVNPEISYLKHQGRISSISVTDDEALKGFSTLSKLEGIIPALESSHAIFAAIKLAQTLDENTSILVNLSGRGDKDVETVSKKYFSKI